mmetsp:Transcript_23268/g.43720  ORF Transcript_23268/g.43720 Transcript_23268/m.43720 type:complete len:264 (-) Transcript_23268:2127-2918(-)
MTSNSAKAVMFVCAISPPPSLSETSETPSLSFKSIRPLILSYLLFLGYSCSSSLVSTAIVSSWGFSLKQRHFATHSWGLPPPIFVTSLNVECPGLTSCWSRNRPPNKKKSFLESRDFKLTWLKTSAETSSRVPSNNVVAFRTFLFLPLLTDNLMYASVPSTLLNESGWISSKEFWTSSTISFSLSSSSTLSSNSKCASATLFSLSISLSRLNAALASTMGLRDSLNFIFSKNLGNIPLEEMNWMSSTLVWLVLLSTGENLSSW